MVVIVVESVKPRIRGHLRRFLVEVTAGVYVGELSARVRERLWRRVVKDLGSGKAAMVWVRAGEQGFQIALVGNEAKDVVDFDGIQLTRNLSLSE